MLKLLGPAGWWPAIGKVICYGDERMDEQHADQPQQATFMGNAWIANSINKHPDFEDEYACCDKTGDYECRQPEAEYVKSKIMVHALMIADKRVTE